MTAENFIFVAESASTPGLRQLKVLSSFTCSSDWNPPLKISDTAQIHGPGTFSAKEYAEWLFSTSDELLGLDVESTPLENSRKASADHKRGIYYPGYAVRTVQIADLTSAWILDANTPQDLLLLELTIGSGKEFVSFTGIDQQAIRLSLGFNIDKQTRDCHHLATLKDPGGFQNGLKALTVKHLDSGLKDAEDAFNAYAKETAPTGHKVGERFEEHKWGLDVHIPEVVAYAGLDAIYVLHLYRKLESLLAHCTNLISREHWLGSLSVGQQFRGLRVDREYATARYEEVVELLTGAGERLTELWDGPPLSPKRLNWLGEHGLPFDELVEAGRIKMTEGGAKGEPRPSLDKDTLPFLAAEFADDEDLGPALKDMLVVSQNSNLRTNLRGMLANLDVNDRVHPNIKIMGAITGRQSVTGPPLQTFRKEDPRLRGCFLADEGMAFVSCDFQNVEVRVAAGLSGDEALTAMVSAGGSMHLNNAYAIFGERITKQDPRYRVAKIGTFACLYGAGAKGLSGQLSISFDEAQAFKNLLIETYPRAFKHYPREMSRHTEVVTDWGRVIPLQFGFEYKAANYYIQSSARELLVDAVRRLIEVYGVPTEWVWLLVHDEIIVQCPTDKVSVVSEILNAAMTSSYRGVPITADVEILGGRWKGVTV